MLKIENTDVLGWENAIRGMRNPMNSWEKSDSGIGCISEYEGTFLCKDCESKGSCLGGSRFIGPNDLDLMKRLRNAGTDHRKFMRMIVVYVDILAPLYWWKEFDTYKIGTDEHLDGVSRDMFGNGDGTKFFCSFEDMLYIQIEVLNEARRLYLETKDKKYWWQMIQLLPSSYNQRRTVMLNYEVLANIYKSRRNHKLDEWRELCCWIEGLPYSELIVGERSDDTGSESKRFVEVAKVFQKSFQEGLEEGLNENKELVFKIPKDQISPEALELLEKGFAVDMSIGFKE